MAEEFDVIMTLCSYPYYDNCQLLLNENKQNNAFVERISMNPEFDPPIFLKLGRTRESTIAICIKKPAWQKGDFNLHPCY